MFIVSTERSLSFGLHLVTKLVESVLVEVEIDFGGRDVVVGAESIDEAAIVEVDADVLIKSINDSESGIGGIEFEDGGLRFSDI